MIQGAFQVGELAFGNTSSANTFANTAGVGIVKEVDANNVVRVVLTNRLGSAFTSSMRINGAESNAIATINGINDHLQDVIHYNFGVINPVSLLADEGAIESAEIPLILAILLDSFLLELPLSSSDHPSMLSSPPKLLLGI